MSFLTDISSFSHKNLRKVETRITTSAGQMLVETSAEGKFSQRAVEGHHLGFVGDLKPDFQVVAAMPGLLIGSQDVAANLELLNEHHVTHILNVATGIDNFFPDDFAYRKVEILDLPETDITGYFETCFQFIDAARENNGTVLVHCNAGVSRSPSIVLAYRMSAEGAPLASALQDLRSLRPAVRPNDGFLRRLREYETELKLDKQ